MSCPAQFALCAPCPRTAETKGTDDSTCFAWHGSRLMAHWHTAHPSHRAAVLRLLRPRRLCRCHCRVTAPPAMCTPAWQHPWSRSAALPSATPTPTPTYAWPPQPHAHTAPSSHAHPRLQPEHHPSFEGLFEPRWAAEQRLRLKQLLQEHVAGRGGAQQDGAPVPALVAMYEDHVRTAGACSRAACSLLWMGAVPRLSEQRRALSGRRGAFGRGLGCNLCHAHVQPIPSGPH